MNAHAHLVQDSEEDVKLNFLHYDVTAGPNNVIQVTLDTQANVLLLDDINFQYYKQSAKFRYYGGLAKVSPFNIRPPHAGHWNVVIDLGGRAGTVHASVRVV
jgi:hypothetical protein